MSIQLVRNIQSIPIRLNWRKFLFGQNVCLEFCREAEK